MAAAKEGIKQKVRGWSHHDSADLYGIDDWGNGYFRISKKGEVTVRLNDEDGGKKDVSLCDLLEGLKERGTTVPVLFRFRDLLRSRIAELNDSFRKAIKEAGYQGKYQGVYPIKVNQQRQVVEEIAEFGASAMRHPAASATSLRIRALRSRAGRLMIKADIKQRQPKRFRTICEKNFSNLPSYLRDGHENAFPTPASPPHQTETSKNGTKRYLLHSFP